MTLIGTNDGIQAASNRCVRQQAKTKGHNVASIQERHGRPSVEDGLRPVLDAIEESRRLLEWQDNWDGERSPGYARATWDRATTFVRSNALSLWQDFGRWMHAPEIMPGSRGRIDIEWSLDDRELLVTIPVDAAEQAEFYGYDRDRAIVIKGRLDTDSPLSAWLLTWIAE